MDHINGCTASHNPLEAESRTKLPTHILLAPKSRVKASAVTLTPAAVLAVLLELARPLEKNALNLTIIQMQPSLNTAKLSENIK